jgi:hypothetical protein
LFAIFAFASRLFYSYFLLLLCIVTDPSFYLQHIETQPADCMRGDPQKGLVVAEVLLHAAEDKSAGARAMAAIAGLATDASEEGLLNNAAAHRIFKQILRTSLVMCLLGCCC